MAIYGKPFRNPQPIPLLTSLFEKQIGQGLQSNEKLMKIRHYYRKASRPRKKPFGGNDTDDNIKRFLCFRIVSNIGTVSAKRIND